MNSFFLYSYKYVEKTPMGEKQVDASVIFCSQPEINKKDLKSEIRTFYETHFQPDKIFVIGYSTIREELINAFIEEQENTFKGIPKREELHLSDNLFLLTFDKCGSLSCENDKKIPQEFLETYSNEGLQQIFRIRGGLIVSESSHHYVFRSGKHCDRFIRTGNILLFSSEIYFIAFKLLPHFKEAYSRIYCDTSSINSIAFALFDLRNSFLEKKLKVSIESFSSYDGLYKTNNTYATNSFLIISALYQQSTKKI